MIYKPSLVNVFAISVELTRPADTTAYAIGDLINTDSAEVLPTLDFSSIASASQKIMITGADVLDENGSASVKLSAILHLFNANSLTGSTLTDNTAFAPTYAEIKAKRVMTLEDVSITTAFGTAAYLLSTSELQRICTLDANAKLYAALIANSAYTPASGGKLALTVRGFLL